MIAKILPWMLGITSIAVLCGAPAWVLIIGVICALIDDPL